MTHSSTYEHWRERALSGPCILLPTERIEEMFLHTVKYGSGNGWRGPSAVTCEMIRELLREREWLLAEWRGG
jgi:hypothetical protein